MFSLEDLEKIISENNAPNFHHYPVQVPDYANPFIAHPELEEAFVETLQHVITTNFIPHELGLHPEEWDNDGYLTGAWTGQELYVELPLEIWMPWAVLWGWALDILTHLIEQYQLFK
ncbi:hypothetical protein QCA50_020005 [Cerrena zonata]|uniref:Uncharacterized protein n=1 Tax=Cerrena zonata TaxID=2478898 RepID=A0AAW0F8B3_9APHY